MANEPFPLVQRNLSDGTVTSENQDAFTNRELVPLIFEMRKFTNLFHERPQLPIFESSPITDADFDPNGTRPPNDGVIAYSSVDNKLYIRVSGAYLASAAFT